MKCTYYAYIDDINGAFCYYDEHSLPNGKCINCTRPKEEIEADEDFSSFKEGYLNSISEYNDD